MPADPLFLITRVRRPQGPVSAAIRDIDVGTNPANTESREVPARYPGAMDIASSPAPLPATDPNSLDGKARSFRTWEASNGDPLESLTLRFTGGNPWRLCVAFDNFETGPEPIPFPASRRMMPAAFIGAAAHDRRR